MSMVHLFCLIFLFADTNRVIVAYASGRVSTDLPVDEHRQKKKPLLDCRDSQTDLSVMCWQVCGDY